MITELGRLFDVLCVAFVIWAYAWLSLKLLSAAMAALAWIGRKIDWGFGPPMASTLHHVFFSDLEDLTKMVILNKMDKMPDLSRYFNVKTGASVMVCPCGCGVLQFVNSVNDRRPLTLGEHRLMAYVWGFNPRAAQVWQ